MNVLFINPSSMPDDEQEMFLNKSSILRNPSFSMPIGLIDLAAYLRNKITGIHIELLDIGKDLYKLYMSYKDMPPKTLEMFIQSELDSINFIPHIVGISVMFSSVHNSSVRIAEMVRKKWKDAIIVCGGNHATNCYDILLQSRSIDYVVRGEGEISFAEFMKKINNHESNIDVYGIFDKDKLKRNVNEISPVLENLDDIPIPAFDLLDVEIYKKSPGGASLMFSRGCIFKCSFCASHTVHGRRLRYKSNDKIIKELKELIYKYNFTSIMVEDDLFAADKDKFLTLADKILALNANINFSLPQGLSVAILDEEIIDAMSRIGINEVAVAIESGSPYTQKHIINKNVSLAKATKILKYLREKDFLIYANFILGFPRETRGLMQETIDFIKTIDVDWIYVLNAMPLPGSEMFQEFISMGVIDSNNFDWDTMRFGHIRMFDAPEITAKELVDLVYDTNIDCNFFNNSNLRHSRYKRAIEVLTRLIINPYPFHIIGRYCRALSYLGINDKERALADFKECIKWIDKNEESRRLFERYGNKMSYFKKYLKDGINKGKSWTANPTTINY